MNTTATLEDEMRALSKEIQAAEKNITYLSGRQYNDVREDTIIFCLKRAYDLARGASIAATTGLPETAYILMRGLFEVFIQTYWIVLSDENAERFAQTTDNEIKRQLRGFLKKDIGTVTHKETGEDKSEEILNEWASLPQLLNMQPMADDAGIGKLCKMMYGNMSTLAHGYTFGLTELIPVQTQLDMSISASLGWLQAINAIAVKWVARRELIPPTEIYDMLGMSRFNV